MGKPYPRLVAVPVEMLFGEFADFSPEYVEHADLFQTLSTCLKNLTPNLPTSDELCLFAFRAIVAPRLFLARW